MDNRRLVKWFDIRYHKKHEAFCRHIARSPSFAGYPNTQAGRISVWGKKPDGTLNWVLNYGKKAGAGDWSVELDPTAWRANSLTSYFEDTECITEEEWCLFEMCEPELVAWLGKNTLKATDIELMLKGRLMIEVKS